MKTRLEKITEATPKWREHIKEAENLALNRSVPLVERTKRFFKIVESAFEPIKPHVICGSGCSHCCHQSVFISSAEAKIISDFTGLAVTLKNTVFLDAQYAKETQAKRIDTPCRFLTNSLCSIYEVRPVPCRVHVSMSDNQSDCSMDNHFNGGLVSLLNTSEFTDPFLRMNRPKSFLADINDFFPTE